jgi:hypothetical protein
MKNDEVAPAVPLPICPICDRPRHFPVRTSRWQPRSCPLRTSTLQVCRCLTSSHYHTTSFTQDITYRSILAAGIHYQDHISTDKMGDLSERDIELEPLTVTENNEDVQAPISPDTAPTFMSPTTEPKKKSSILNIFSRQKKDKVDKFDKGKAPATPETVGESSKAGEAAAPVDKGKAPATEVEDDAPPVELEADAPPQIDFRPSVVSRDFAFAGPSSAAPPPSDEVAPDEDPHSSLPTIMITPATPRAWSFVDGEVNPYLLATPRHDKEVEEAENRRGEGSKPKDPGFRYHPLKIPEEPGDYPHITEPRNLKRFGDLPHQTRHIHIPLATHWVDLRPCAKYAGEPLFKLSKACPYILVPRILAARLQLIVETPTILPDEVKELAAERGLDVATLEGYDIAMLHILGALWND